MIPFVHYFTNKFRKAENILRDQVKEFNTNEDNLLKIRKLALEGYKSGIPASVIYRWLAEKKGCPLTDSTVRSQLNTDSKK